MESLSRYFSLLAVAVAASFVVVSVVAFADGPRHVGLGCGDFPTQQQAQDFFHAHGGPWHDIHGLDTDRNGLACEQLP